jgi:hypothetical protein
MTTPATSSPSPNENSVRYERVDDLTVNVYIDGQGDTTVRPWSPSVRKILERDREQIAELIARFRREQERLKAKPPQPPKADDPNQTS